MMKRGILVIIMMISTLGLYSFKYNANDNDEVKTSYASYYHDKFNGRKTASGELFSNDELTAAHRTLKFGTRVLVKNLRTNKTVVVTINDRGPFHSSRALDLSKAAYDEIGDLDRGVIPIEYQIID